MKEELQNKLFEKYPKIFQGRSLPPTENLMCFGIECGDGWYWLLDMLCGSIQWRIDNPAHDKNGPITVEQVIAVQVKEKFGGLRFYYEGGNNDIRSIVSFAEKQSNYICEVCGSTKNVGQTSGWITTLCKNCAAENKSWKEYDD